MRRVLAAAWIAGSLVSAAPHDARAEAQVTGLADFVAKNTGESELTNYSFGGFSNFDTIRLRLFFDASIGEKTSVFTQLLTSNDEIVLYGAYARFEEVAGGPVGLQAGYIPGTVGSFGERTYSDKNPLIGTPLMYIHHTTLCPEEFAISVDDLVATQADRSRFGLPILYDNCWNSGVEAYAPIGPIDASFALLTGSVTKPARNQEKDVPQGTARLVWHSGPGLQIGVSGYLGPYLTPGSAAFPAGKNENDYMNLGAAVDVAWSARWVEVHAEAIACRWEYPDLPDLDAYSGYAEAKWKVYTQWYVAARVEAFETNEVPNSSGQDVKWDDPVRRIEYGVGYKPRPRTTLKLVAQHDRFETYSQYDADLYALQAGIAF